MKEYITSDWHFGHKNMCGVDSFLDTRKQFSDTTDMDSYIISTINSIVTNSDVIYHLGDISLHRKHQDIYSLLTSIKGQLVLFKGNHDSSKLFKYIRNNNYELPDGRPKFVLHDVGTIIKRNGIVYYLTHYPLGLGEFRKNMRNICGHIHEQTAREANVINIGIDSPELPTDLTFAEPVLLDTAMDLVNIKWSTWYNGVERLIKK